MANTISGGIENKISTAVQKGLKVTTCFPKLASFREEATLYNGQVVNRPSVKSMLGKGEAYVANTDITATEYAYAQETLTVNQSNATLIKVDKTEEKQLMVGDENKPTKYFSRDILQDMRFAMEKDYLDEIDNAAFDIDAADFGGSALSPIDPTANGVEEIISKALSEVRASRQKSMSGQYVIADSYLLHYLQMRGLALGFNVADSVFRNGYTNESILGAKIFYSELIPWTLTLTMSDVAVANDTFTIAGVTCTAKAAPSAAGEFDVEASADAQGTTIAALINGTGTPSADTYIALAQADRDTWDSYGLSASNSSGVVTITGYGRVTFSETLTNGAFGNLALKYKVGNIGDVDMVAQIKPFIEISPAPMNFGKNVKGMTLWGTKTFTDGTKNGCSVLIQGN